MRWLGTRSCAADGSGMQSREIEERRMVGSLMML